MGVRVARQSSKAHGLCFYLSISISCFCRFFLLINQLDGRKRFLQYFDGDFIGDSSDSSSKSRPTESVNKVIPNHSYLV